MSTKKIGGNARKKRKKQLFNLWGVNSQAPCWWCLKILSWETGTLEHMMPKSLDGSHRLENLRLACKECNEGHVNPLDPCHPKNRQLTF